MGNWLLSDLPPALRKQAQEKLRVTTHILRDARPVKSEGNGVKSSKPRKPKPPRPPRVANKYVQILLDQIKAAGLREPTLECQFHATRRWRIDVAWKDIKLGIEVDGAVYTNGRHTRGKGYEQDCIKANQAQLLGWKLLRYSTGQVKQGLPILDLKLVFA